MSELTTWLNQEVDQRGWSFNELARRADVSSGHVSLVMTERQKPGYEFCVKVANALDEPPENVLRLAGLLPPIPEPVAEEREMLNLFRQLPRASRIVIIRILQVINEIARETPSGVIVVTAPPEDTTIQGQLDLFGQLWKGSSQAEKNAIVKRVMEESETDE